VVDLKARRVYYKGIRLPSGKDGIQQRHIAFLFILARNPGRAMSYEDIQEKVDEFRLDRFSDRPNNIRNQIRKTLRAVAREHPDKITDNKIDALLKAVSKGLTRLTLVEQDIFSIYNDEEYPSL
jgi:DNA-binding response OmpR family regulator